MITTPSHSLVFGDITLVEQGANPPDASGIRYVVLPGDTTWGNPSPITVALLSLIRQGSLVAYDHTENREPVLKIAVEADDGDLLARGEKALQLECERANTLTWTPPDGSGEPSVFDVVWSSLDFSFDDQQELLRRRVYLLKIQALPYAREANLVTTAAQASGSEVVTVSDGSSLTGWSDQTGSGIASTAGAIVITQENTYYAAAAFWTQTVDLTVGSYVAVIWQTSAAVANSLTCWLASADSLFYFEGRMPMVASSVSGGWTTSYFAIPAGWTTTPKMLFRVFFPGAGTSTLSIDKFSIWNGLPFIGTARQKALGILPGGSVRTQGSIQVSHATSSLGKTIVYTTPTSTGYLPPLRQWLSSSSGVTPDATVLSGNRNGITTATVYRVPVTSSPAGRTEAWAWLRNANAVTIRVDVTAVSVMNATTIGSSQTSQTDVVFGANVWQLAYLGTFTLPPSQVGPSGYVQISIQRGTTAEAPEIDEGYLFGTDAGRLTVVDCGTSAPVAGGPSNRLWIDGPDPSQPQGGVWRGNASDKSDAWHAGASATPWEIHDFDSEGTTIFFATPNATDASASLTHYRRYHTHVIRET